MLHVCAEALVGQGAKMLGSTNMCLSAMRERPGWRSGASVRLLRKLLVLWVCQRYNTIDPPKRVIARCSYGLTLVSRVERRTPGPIPTRPSDKKNTGHRLGLNACLQLTPGNDHREPSLQYGKRIGEARTTASLNVRKVFSWASRALLS